MSQRRLSHRHMKARIRRQGEAPAPEKVSADCCLRRLVSDLCRGWWWRRRDGDGISSFELESESCRDERSHHYTNLNRCVSTKIQIQKLRGFIRRDRTEDLYEETEQRGSISEMIHLRREADSDFSTPKKIDRSKREGRVSYKSRLFCRLNKRRHLR